MKVRVLLSDGKIITLPSVQYHPAYSAMSWPGGPTDYPAGCWVRLSSIKKYNDRYNDAMDSYSMQDMKRTVNQLIESISCAELPFDILDDESDEPWRNSGNRLKEVRYGMTDLFWKNH